MRTINGLFHTMRTINGLVHTMRTINRLTGLHNEDYEKTDSHN